MSIGGGGQFPRRRRPCSTGPTVAGGSSCTSRERRALSARRIPDDLSPLHHLDQHPDPVPPMLLVRAGGDRPQLNATFDWFLTECLARNLDLECMNHSEAPHAFDVLDDSKRSTEIIHRTLEFLTTRLVRELDSAGD